MNNEESETALPSNWREMWNEMQSEWDRLHREISQLRMERDQLSKALVSLLHEDVTMSDEEILAQIEGEKPLREFLQEMRSQLAEN